LQEVKSSKASSDFFMVSVFLQIEIPLSYPENPSLLQLAFAVRFLCLQLLPSRYCRN